MRHGTTRGYFLCLKLFELTLLAATITTYWQGTLVSIKPESLLAKNTTGQALEKILRPMLRAVTFSLESGQTYALW